MATHHGGTGHCVTRDDIHVKDPETTGMDNDNDSISGLNATVAWGKLEAGDNSDELLPTSQAKLIALMREINNVHQ